MTEPKSAYIAGAFEHPARHLPDKSVAEIHAEVAAGALRDCGLSIQDVDGYFCGDDAPGWGGISMADYLGLRVSYIDSTEVGGSSYLSHIGHAAAAIAAGKCRVALVTQAGNPRATRESRGIQTVRTGAPEYSFEDLYGATIPAKYALVAKRHMHEFGTTSAQLAEVKVAASLHAQHNANAYFQEPVTIDDVLSSPLISDPIHRLDSCIVTDGGGALVIVSPDIAKNLSRHCVPILGHGEAVKHTDGGRLDLLYSAAVWSGPRAFREAGLTPADVDYISVYDSFTITVAVAIEDLGFCEKGRAGAFIAEGNLRSPGGALPFNTDGGGLCNNHPGNRGGMVKAIEAVRQLRGEANQPVQVPDCEIAVAHGTGGALGTRSGSTTIVLGRGD